MTVRVPPLRVSRVSERDRAATTGHESELFERSRIATVVLDLNEREIISVNAAAEQLVGLPREEILGRPAADFIDEEVADETLRTRGLRGVTTRTIRMIRSETGPRMAEISMTPTAEDGVVFVQLLDLTDLAPETPQSLDPGRVLDASPAATIIVDLASRQVTRLNPSAASLLGTSGQQAVGRPLAEFAAGGDELDRLLSAVDADETGGRHATVTMLRTAEGRRPVRVDAVGLLDTPSAVLHLEMAHRRRPARHLRSVPEAEVGDGVDPTNRRRFQVVCGAALAALGAVVLVVGWWLGVDSVTRIAPDLASMKANTALGLSLIGGALLIGERGRGQLARAALFVLLLVTGALTTLEYVFEIDLGIDELLAAETNLTATSSPGRMGLNTALCFTAIGLGALLGGARRTRRQIIAGQVAIMLSAALAFLALLAYIYGATGSRGLASSTEMALHTSVAVIVAALGILSTQLDSGVIAPLGAPLAGGRFARRIMPVGVGLVVASGLAAKALTRRDLLTDPDLELAFFALAVAGSLFVVVVLVARYNNALDARAERSRRDLAAVMAAFSDRHYRVDVDGVATAVTGARVAHETTTDALVPDDFRERLSQALTRSRAEGTVAELTFTPEDGQGKRELRVAPLSAQEMAVSIRDISELAATRDALAELTESLEDEVRARTAELEDANHELERSNADLEQFAYLASHDLQEPLRMVSTFVDKLAMRLGDDLDERSTQYVTFAVDGAERMSALIDGLLQYSRAGRDRGNPQPVELDDVVPDVLHALSERIADQDATVDVDPDLPTVWADEVLLRQVFQNLLGNALKFVDPDRRPHVHVDARRVGSVVEIGVADNGVGIPAEFRRQVFLMFRRLHARSSYAGTGIGLSLVQRLVESQGGRVWIDDDHGPHGVRFVFTMPVPEWSGSGTTTTGEIDP